MPVIFRGHLEFQGSKPGQPCARQVPSPLNCFSSASIWFWSLEAWSRVAHWSPVRTQLWAFALCTLFPSSKVPGWLWVGRPGAWIGSSHLNVPELVLLFSGVITGLLTGSLLRLSAICLWNYQSFLREEALNLGSLYLHFSLLELKYLISTNFHSLRSSSASLKIFLHILWSFIKIEEESAWNSWKTTARAEVTLRTFWLQASCSLDESWTFSKNV